jgi:hypothetical protein
MANFAQLNSENIVISLHYVQNEVILDENDEESENLGIEFCKKLFGNHTNWKQTSYNSNFRNYYAQIGFSYNQELDAFIPPKPYSSWILREDKLDWTSPIGSAPFLTTEQKKEGLACMWDEDLYRSDNSRGWKIVNIKDAFPRKHIYK